MRITNAMMSATFMADLQNNLTILYERQMQQSTGKRIQKLSDDPVGIIQGLNARTQLANIEQYQRDITKAKQWLESSETYMSEMSDIAKSAYELCVGAGTSTETNEDRLTAIAPQARALLDQLVSVCNSTTSDEYTFGGFNTRNNKPVAQATAAGTSPLGVAYTEGEWLYNGEPMSSFNGAKIQTVADANDLQFKIGFGMNMSVSKTVPELLVYDSKSTPPENFISRLEELCQKLETGNCPAEDVQAFIKDFQTAQANIDANISQMGGRYNRCEMMETRYSKDDLMYATVKSTLEDVDIAEAIMNFSMAQAVYTASLQVGAQVIQPTLLDYLR